MIIPERVSQLKKRIDDLHKIINADMGASFKEAAQSTEMLLLYEKQLQSVETAEMQKHTANQAKFRKIFTLQDHLGKISKYRLTENLPDPGKHLISINSPLGKLLMSAKLHDRLNLNDKVYKVTKIQELKERH